MQDIWQFKTLLNLLAAIDALASGGSLLVSVDSSPTPTRNDVEELFIHNTHINTLIMTVLMLV